jgi:hypothetical protein
LSSDNRNSLTTKIKNPSSKDSAAMLRASERRGNQQNIHRIMKDTLKKSE